MEFQQQSRVDPKTRTTLKMRFQTSGSTKTKTSKNRLTVNLEEDDTEVSIFGEEDIILVEYEETPKTPLNNEDTPKTPRNKGVKPRRQEAGVEDEEINIPEAIVIDLDTPTRKLEMEARVDLEKMNIKQQMVTEFSKGSRLSGSFRSTKVKKRKAEVEEEVEVIDEDDEEEWSPNLAKLLAKRSRLSQNLARQRRNNGMTRF